MLINLWDLSKNFKIKQMINLMMNNQGEKFTNKIIKRYKTVMQVIFYKTIMTIIEKNKLQLIKIIMTNKKVNHNFVNFVDQPFSKISKLGVLRRQVGRQIGRQVTAL